MTVFVEFIDGGTQESLNVQAISIEDGKLRLHRRRGRPAAIPLARIRRLLTS